MRIYMSEKTWHFPQEASSYVSSLSWLTFNLEFVVWHGVKHFLDISPHDRDLVIWGHQYKSDVNGRKVLSRNKLEQVFPMLCGSSRQFVEALLLPTNLHCTQWIAECYIASTGGRF